MTPNRLFIYLRHGGIMAAKSNEDTIMGASADAVVYARVTSGTKKDVKSPNAVTQAAIFASRAGKVVSFSSVEDLFADLNDDND